MGKRKERRLAAKIGAGRRVKLDLFAEPSGNFFLFLVSNFKLNCFILGLICGKI